MLFYKLCICCVVCVCVCVCVLYVYLIQATARQALEMGEQLGHLNPFLAEQKFREALAVCAVYHFYEEMGEVYQRLGQLHLNIRRYDTAFQHCCEGLQCYPSAKV